MDSATNAHAPIPTAEAARKSALVDSVGFWWHTIDVGDGVVTPGIKTGAQLAAEFAALNLPTLNGLTVLDIGAWDGFFSFEADRQGASRVVALDWYVWALRLPEVEEYKARCADQGIAQKPLTEIPELWSEELPGKRGFDIAHQLLDSRIDVVAEDFMTVDPESLGRFDITLFLGVLYHQRHPLLALERVREFTRSVAVIESHAAVYPGLEHLAMCEFFELNELANDPTNWWAPNLTALIKLCRAAGFGEVDVVVGPTRELLDLPPGAAPAPYRAIVHARP